MLYLLAAVGVVTVAVLLWRAFVTPATDTPTARRPSTIAPDDDPDFLRGLNKRTKRPDSDGPEV